MFLEILNTFETSIQTVLALMEDSQKWLASKQEAFGAKFEETAQKIKIVTADCQTVAHNVYLKDNVVEQLNKLRTSGFEGFVGQTDAAYAERVSTTNSLIAPYRTLADALSPICLLQTAMVNAAQMKKIPLRYDDIKSNISKAKQLIGEMKASLDKAVRVAVGEDDAKQQGSSG
jgi:hypothetical protein